MPSKYEEPNSIFLSNLAVKAEKIELEVQKKMQYFGKFNLNNL